jgi:hypothetical protein
LRELGRGPSPAYRLSLVLFLSLFPDRFARFKVKPSGYMRSGRIFYSCDPDEEMIR